MNKEDLKEKVEFEDSQKETLGKIKIIEVKERDDGYSDISFETDEVFDKMVAKKLGVNYESLTAKQVSDFVQELLEKSLEEKEGFAIQESKDEFGNNNNN